MVKESQATIDGTMKGPDAIAELVAMHLHRLGAAKPKVSPLLPMVLLGLGPY